MTPSLPSETSPAEPVTHPASGGGEAGVGGAPGGPRGALLEGFRAHRPIALARAISLVENEREGFEAFLDALLRERESHAVRVGVTGPPGVGKSTLVAALARAYRAEEREVGILAVDPSSPFSGGALLGDRVRMPGFVDDPGTFVRSMASRGSSGGLATTSHEVIDLMEAFGFPIVLVETVGVGQAEIDVARATDSVVVVLVPESGDGIQAMKAGLMEAADLFVVNKRDRPGAEELSRELRSALRLRGSGDGDDGWTVPVLLTEAQSGDGVSELAEALAEHREHLLSSGEMDRRRTARMADRIRRIVDRRVRSHTGRLLGERDFMDECRERIRNGTATPYSIAEELLRPWVEAAREERGER